MASLSNKNKRRGYKVPPAILPPKITFEPSNGATNGIPEAVSASKPRLQLVPPSERRDLPANMFVTSVDVEEDLRCRSAKPTKLANEVSWIGPLTLDYGDPVEDNTSPNQDAGSVHQNILPAVNWVEAEQQWSAAQTVDGLHMLHPKALIGYKVCLGFHPHFRLLKNSTGFGCQSSNIYS